MKRIVLVLALVTLATRAADSSTDAAYAAFVADVRTTCTALAKAQLADPIALVDAHGSATYGMALVYGRPRAPKGAAALPGLASIVCVYAKATKKAEISGPLETNFVAR